LKGSPGQILVELLAVDDTRLVHASTPRRLGQLRLRARGDHIDRLVDLDPLLAAIVAVADRDRVDR
jgi:hypothetical protein